jgi:hypothetical protein
MLVIEPGINDKIVPTVNIHFQRKERGNLFLSESIRKRNKIRSEISFLFFIENESSPVRFFSFIRLVGH